MLFRSYKNIKIYNLSPEQSNILKQTALSVGADCGTHREVIKGGIAKSNAILGGSYSQLLKISEKLARQPFGLKILSKQIQNFLIPKKSKTKIVGILNITPDSFSDGGMYLNIKDAEKHLFQLIEEGADMIDIGAESTRPFSTGVSSDEQIERLTPILKLIKKENITIPVSIDTRSSVVAECALDYGVQIINDVSGFDFDSNMPKIIAKYKAGAIIQHSQGTPDNMQISPHYENLIDDIFFSLRKKIEYAQNIGIKNIIADVGIGFGKTKNDNFELLNRIEEFYSLNTPIMAGVSRKSLICANDCNNDIKDALTLAISYPLIQKNIHYLRVHNVKLHKLLTNLL